MNRRIVIDTNVYVRRALRLGSVPAKAVDKAWIEDNVLLSTATWSELQIVLRRSKFSRYMKPDALETYLERIFSIAAFVEIVNPIRACRDPRDDKFLEVAVHGQADLILTGDVDLLELHPFRGVSILTPVAYLESQ